MHRIRTNARLHAWWNDDDQPGLRGAAIGTATAIDNSPPRTSIRVGTQSPLKRASSLPVVLSTHNGLEKFEVGSSSPARNAPTSLYREKRQSVLPSAQQVPPKYGRDNIADIFRSRSDPALHVPSDPERALDTTSSTASYRGHRHSKEYEYRLIKRNIAAVFRHKELLLFPFIPAGFALDYTLGPSVATFAVNLVALIPVSKITGQTLRLLDLKHGTVFAGFVYITASNLVQIVSSILLLKTNQLDVLRTNLIGGILSSLLLVLGGAYIYDGYTRSKQYFNVSVSHISSCTLMLGATSILTPTAANLLKQTSTDNLLRQSRGISVVLFLVYAFLLFFSFYTHRDEYTEESQKVPPNTLGRGEAKKGIAGVATALNIMAPEAVRENAEVDYGEEAEAMELDSGEKRDGSWMPEWGWVVRRYLSWMLPILAFAAATAILAFNTSFAVDSISAITEPDHLSADFLGLILLPILNNDLEPFFLAGEDKMDTVFDFTVGKCIQTAMFVTPLIVMIAWGLHIELALYFDGFETLSLFTSILLLNFVVGPGESHWIEGVVLLGDWAMIAVAAFYVD